MSSLNLTAVCGGLLTAAFLFLMHYLPGVPLWAAFLAWACFFHLGGGQDPGKVFAATLMHLSFGAVASWLTALLLLLSPWQSGWFGLLWPPILIGLVIALIMRAGSNTRLAVTPAIIYGYAAIWAYLSMEGRFSMQALLSLSLQNALVAVLTGIFLGAVMGYLNAMLLARLTRRVEA